MPQIMSLREWYEVHIAVHIYLLWRISQKQSSAFAENQDNILQEFRAEFC